MTQNYVIRMYRKKPHFVGWLLLNEKKQNHIGPASNGPLILRFANIKNAKQYIINNKLKNGGWQCTVLPESVLQADADYPATPIVTEMFCIVNEAGHNMFHDVAKNEFFFADKEVGYIAFDTTENCQKFIDSMTFEHPIFIKELKPEKPKLSIA